MATISGSDTIKKNCELEWDRWKNDCSGFIKAVGARLGIAMTGNANTLIDSMRNKPWVALGKSPAKANQAAKNGYFVIAGLKATPNGHVAVVVPGGTDAVPNAYWGQLGGVGKKNTGVNWSWKKTDLPNVEYFYHAWK